MKKHTKVGLAIGMAAVVVGCAAAPRPAAVAAGVERVQCDRASASQDELVRSIQVISVSPLYSHVMTSNTAEDRVAGAEIIVRPAQGVSAEQLTRALQCHNARVVLGQIASKDPNDPYSLPDQWVNIQVKPQNGNFAVTISADSVHENLAVYGRANHYADEHMVATDPGL